MNQISSIIPEQVIPKDRVGTSNTGYVTAVNPKQISENDIGHLWEIEKDMWAHGLGEYMQCNHCGNIDGKYDIYSKEKIGTQLVRKTVSEIERTLNNQSICCSKCHHTTQAIFPESYKDDISSRYAFEKSFLSIYKDTTGKIRGFMDGYVADFPTIYQREYSHYYGESSMSETIGKIETTIWHSIPKKLLCITALGTDEESASMYTIYALMKNFFEQVLLYNPYITGTYESVLGTNTHGIYDVCGGKRSFSTISDRPIENTHEGVISDIFIHPMIAENSLSQLGISVKYFLRNHGKRIKKIVENQQ